MLVDTHTHVVSDDPGSYPLSPSSLPGNWFLESPCSAEGLRREMDATGVDGAVLVQPVGAYSFDNRYAVDSAAALPNRFVSAVAIDLFGVQSAEVLTYWLAKPAVRGVRLFAISQDGTSLSDPALLPLWEQAASSSAHIIVTILQHQLDELAAVLESFTDAPVSLDHCGFCDVSNLEPLARLARFENLHLKVTTNVIDAAAAVEGTARPFVRKLVDAFGADRLVWGSDYCQTHDRPYSQLVRAGIEAFGGLSEAQQEACLGVTASRLWFGA